MRDFLSEDGVIFISIDDNEQANLRKICDEIFGIHNKIAEIVWEKMYTTKNDASHISMSHEYLFCYARDFAKCRLGLLPRTEEMDARYSNPDNDPRGDWKAIPLYAKGATKSGSFPITSPVTGKRHFPPADSHWRYTVQTIENMIRENRVWFGKDGASLPNTKRFLSEVQQGTKPRSLWSYSEVGSNDSAKKEMREIFIEGDIFPFPKPSTLIKRIIQIGTGPNDYVLDFFSGSAATAHAVMQLNAEDGGRRKFIMIQLPESCTAESEAAKAGFKTICDIGKERVRRAGDKIKAEHATTAPNLDIGFRVLKVADTNMTDVYYNPSASEQKTLDGMQRNIKDDRTDLDLLFGCLLDWGLPLSLLHTSEKVNGFTLHDYNNGAMVACFDEKISEETIIKIARKRPLRAVFRDVSFESDSGKTNVFEIFKALSPATGVRVI